MSTLTPNEMKTARRRGLALIAAATVVGGLGWAGWQWLHAGNFQSTDNAYVAGHVVQITPQVAGTVVSIGVEDTEFVRAGQVLVQLDAADARIALEQAQAQLAQTVREVRTLFANHGALKAQIRLREADLARAQAEAVRLQDDVNRRAPLLATGAVAQEELQHAKAQLTSAQSAVAAAQSALLTAKEQLLASQTQTDGTTPQEHPSVQRAAAHVREAHLALERTQLRAPVDGHIAKRGVQLGQRVAAGAPLMTVVALDKLWVDANFKESQLQSLRIGQPAELTADVYGSKTVYHGTVAGLGAGTGAAFALLPAQNATGNWIKVVQRVPVRIALDAKEVAVHPLRVGLSMEAVVDVHQQEGKSLADTPRTDPAQSTQVFNTPQHTADAEVQAIIATHLGHPPVAVASSTTRAQP